MAPARAAAPRRHSRRLGGLRWALVAALVQPASAIARHEGPCAGCPPALAQRGGGRPWRTFVPSNSDAPVTPCGCAAGAPSRLVPKGELRDRSDAQLTALSSKLRDEVAALEAETATATARNAELLDSLRGRLQALGQNATDRLGNASGAQAAQEAAHAALKAEVAAADGEAAALSEAAGKAREELKAVHAALQKRVLSSAGCRNCSALVAVHQLHGLQAASADPHEELVRQVDALQNKRAALQEGLEKDMLATSAAQRALLDQMQVLKVKLRLRAAASAQADYRLVAEGRRLADHRSAALRFRQGQADALARVANATAAASNKLAEVEAAMKRCGC